MALLKPTHLKNEVPVLFHEPHVEGGFRPLHQPWGYYLASLFQRHNECLNTWTHLIALVMTLQRLYEFSQEFDLLYDPYMWPLLAGMVTMILLYIGSSGAHCFQSRSELVHYTCFMVDYAGIGLYGLGSTILHYAYCSDPWLFSVMKHLYLPVAIFLSILVCVCCSISKTMYQRPYPFTRKVWQLASVILIYTWLILPVIHRLLICLETSQWDDSISHHLQQMVWFITSGFFFGSDIPQRFYPGKFDFLGHSHQLFHFCVMMTSYKQLDSVLLDIKQFEVQIRARPMPSFYSTIGAVIFVSFANTLVVIAFREYVKQCHVSSPKKQNGCQNGVKNAKSN